MCSEEMISKFNKLQIDNPEWNISQPEKKFTDEELNDIYDKIVNRICRYNVVYKLICFMSDISRYKNDKCIDYYNFISVNIEYYFYLYEYLPENILNKNSDYSISDIDIYDTIKNIIIKYIIDNLLDEYIKYIQKEKIYFINLICYYIKHSIISFENYSNDFLEICIILLSIDMDKIIEYIRLMIDVNNDVEDLIFDFYSKIINCSKCEIKEMNMILVPVKNFLL